MCLTQSRQEYSPIKKHDIIRVKRTRNIVHWVVSIVLILLFYLTNYKAVAIRKGRLLSPSSFTALSGDLHVQIHYNINDLNDTKKLNNFTISNTKENNTISVLVISKYADDIDTATTKNPKNTTDQLLQRQRKEIVQNIPLYNDPRLNVTQIAVPCQTFVRGGGLYEMKVISNIKNTALPTEFRNVTNYTLPALMVTTTLIPVEDERLRQILDVRWPSAVMEVSPIIFRTYPEHPVHITLRFPDVNCDIALHLPELPDFWLELVYYGKERTYAQNTTQSNVLFKEQVRGFPKYMSFQLDCKLFGLAGQYAVQLRPMVSKINVPTIRRYITIDWSDKFVFNVYASSIFPCDPHTGVGVLYEYPNCILEQGDRVRVYAKLRADVASLQPPTSLHYISEQRVVKSQHALYFSCELFSERYVEYCFSYVSQAISGAVADVRMDCVPTLPVSDSDTGGWGPWSDWTSCSSNCLGGTRNRYRFCDSPPPRYGAKFCDGNSVETEKCGDGLTNTWSCIYQSNSGNSKIDKNHTAIISQEIGPGCRCGCIVHLGSSKPKRIIAGSTQSCPDRSFWLIQVDGKNNIAFSLNFLRLPCNIQYIKLRDGPSLSSTLLIELNGGNLPFTYSDEKARNSSVIEQLQTTGAQLLIEFYSGVSINNNTSNTEDISTPSCIGGFLANVEQIAQSSKNGTTTLLAANKIWIKNNINTIAQKSKYRTKFTLVHLSAVIFAAIIILISALLGAQYIIRYRKYHLAIAKRRDEGSRLHTPHASMNSLHPPSRALSTTTLLSEVIYLVKMRPKHRLRHSILRESIDAETIVRETEFADGKLDVILSQMTKCEEELGSNGTLVALRNGAISPSHSCTLKRSVSNDDKLNEEDNTNTNVEESVEAVSSAHSGTLTHNTTKDSESIISSGMSSLYNSPPLNTKCCTDHYDICTTKTINSCLDEYHLQQYNTKKLSSKIDHERKEFYSPIAASLFSSTNITAINIKENKEQQNRRKLLTRPSSEFSLGTQQELEIDYYDYNVINAGAAPGSYLGMDPAYLVWIPPFEDVVIETDKILSPLNDKLTTDFNEIDALYEKLHERMPKYYLSPRSNSESRTNTPINQTALTTPTSDELSINGKNYDTGIMKSLPVSNMTKQSMSYLQRKKGRPKHSKSTLSLRPFQRQSDVQAIQLNELNNCIVAVPSTISTSDDVMTNSYVEKETRVVKSPSDLQHFLTLDDIQFADESENDSMNDSNVHTSLSESKLHKNINIITIDNSDNTITELLA